MQLKLSQWAVRSQTSAVRDILKLTQGGEVISFAGGLPAEDMFPLEAVKKAFEKVFEESRGSLQYGLTEGYTPLRAGISDWMRQKGADARPEDILVTTGSQQAIDLAARALLDPGDAVLVENPTYLAALQVFSGYGAHLVPVDGDAFGPDPDDLATKIERFHPKMFYAIPTFSNPTGRVWSPERRLAVLEACRSRGVAVLEDDPYGELGFDSETPPHTLFSLRHEVPGAPMAYTSTFSKTVAPGLRTGWIAADPELAGPFARIKQAADLHSSGVDQQALFHLLRDFDLKGHILRLRTRYKERMEAMSRLLTDYSWRGARWERPAGGMFFWLELDPADDAESLLRQAIVEGVAFVPGIAFFAGEPKRNTLRLNFTYCDERTLHEGMARLDRAVTAFHAQSGGVRG